MIYQRTCEHDREGLARSDFASKSVQNVAVCVKIIIRFFAPNSILAGVLNDQKRSGKRVCATGAPTGGRAVVEERVHAGPLWFWPP